MVVFSVAGVELFRIFYPTLSFMGVPLVEVLNPYRAMRAVLDPQTDQLTRVVRASSVVYVGCRLTFAAALVAFGTWKLRKWNPGRNEPRELREEGEVEAVETLVEIKEEAEETVAVGSSSRASAGGSLAEPLIIKGCYVLLFALGMGIFFYEGYGLEDPLRSTLGLIPIGLGILSLILINAQGVTALTSERDTGALDLLLVSELTPKEFIYGKLYGILYNCKEMIAFPLVTAVGMWVMGILTGENLILFVIDFLLLCHFSAMLGLHAAITYTSSRTAVANSLATIFLLMVGILLCAFLIKFNKQEFARQLLSFMIFIGAGSVALFGSLGSKNPSHAIALVSLLTPFWTFYCIISLDHGDVMAAFLVSAGLYGFAILAMLVPAVGDFDIALGRTSAIQG
jgi:hypothetical protein